LFTIVKKLLPIALLLPALLLSQEAEKEERWREHFNRLYQNPAPSNFTTEPNAFLASVVAGLKPGRSLDVSMGQGRNTVFMAAKGWESHGFDVAEEGPKAAHVSARKAGVKIHTVLSRSEDFDYGKEKWDLIFFTYAFAPFIDAAYVQRIWEGLKPGGLVLIEHPMFDPAAPLEVHDWLNAIPKAYAERFQILLYREEMDISEWQQSPVNRLEDKRRMVRFLARKFDPSVVKPRTKP
jgi:predicted O-methyltransferase YrrM